MSNHTRFADSWYSGVHGKDAQDGGEMVAFTIASHVGDAASRVGGAISIQTTSQEVGDVSNQMRVAAHAGVQGGADSSSRGNCSSSSGSDHGMADVAVVEQVEWSENTLARAISMKTMERLWILCRSELGELGVGEPCNRPKTGKVWSTRWCYRRKGDAVRCRLVVRQFREGTGPSVHAGTADFSVTFMHTQ